MSDLLINIVDDSAEKAIKDEQRDDLGSWKVAIIDDEDAVHQVTKLALADVIINERKLEFISAYSGEEGFKLLQQHPDCAVVLLDVVMEQADSGLKLADRIRSELMQNNLQIILRTGQPGYAPEEDVIARYEINDYKTKSELTHNKLYTSIATAIRSYVHLCSLEESKEGLRHVIRASANLMKERSVHEFANGVLKQINAMFNLRAQGIFCVSQRPQKGPEELSSDQHNAFQIVATSQQYTAIHGKNLQDIDDSLETQLVESALSQKQHIFGSDYSALYLSTPSQWEGVIVTKGNLDPEVIDQEILKVFCMNISLGLENAKFFSHLNEAAYTDNLTGLYSRTGLIEHAQQSYQGCEDKLTLFIVDIDYFHEIIDSLGYDFGSEVLKKMAFQLRQSFVSEAIIARLHTDVFAIALPDSKLDIKAVSKICSKPLIVEGNSIRLGVTLGEAHEHAGQYKLNADELLRHAEIALKVAKEEHRGAGKCFEPQFEQDKRSRLDMLADFRNGLAQHELFLVLQPKVAVHHQRIVGYEALIRWQHPQKGLIPPVAFIPIVEHSGLYFELDLYVFKQALMLLNNHPEIDQPVSINISANSLHHHDFISELKKLMAQYDVDIARIEIEITENALIRSDMAILHLRALKALGFVLCLDDFGAGYSSLAYLAKLPLDVIKIDRSFVSSIDHSDSALAILKGMLQICQQLNKRIVVEGVETAEQLSLIKSLGVEVVQGFYFYKPMHLEQVLSLHKQ